MILISIFLIFLQIGLLSFGGGLASLPLIKSLVVEQQQWLSNTMFLDILSISQMTPGPIGINAATFIGFKLYGPIGAAIATIGFVFPSFVILSIISYFYQKYKTLDIIQTILKVLRPVVIALITSAGISITISSLFNDKAINLDNFQVISFGLLILSLILIRLFKIAPIKCMFIAGILNVLIKIVLF